MVVNSSRLLFSVVILATLHFFVYETFLPWQAEAFRWGWLAVSAILGLAIGDGLLIQAFVWIGPRLSSLMMSAVPIFSLILSWLIFGETINGQEAFGIALTVAGIAWVVSERRSEEVTVINKQYGWGILCGLGAALGQASGLVTAKFALTDDFPAFSATLMRMIAATAVLWSFALARGQVGFIIKQWQHRTALAATVAGTITGPVVGVWFSLLAIQLARIGIASTLMSLTPIILIPVAYFLYKERITVRGILGTLVTLIGVGLIFL